MRSDPDGARKVILATNIAETSLTIEGVRLVVDSGLTRRARYDRTAGVTRLVTERASLAAATQRAGRAARQSAGIAVRLWEEAADGGLPQHDPPEILESDLSSLLLDCAAWGEKEPAKLRWLDPPPAASMIEARKRLLALDAIDGEGNITSHGKAMADIPLPPALAHMLIIAARRGHAMLGAEVAMLLTERGLGGRREDLEARLDRWRGERGRKADAARRLATGWANRVEKYSGKQQSDLSLAACVALAFPDRLSRARDATGENWQSAGGRGFRLDPASPLSSSDWLAVADVQGSAATARILSAAAISLTEVETLFSGQISTGEDVRFDRSTGGVVVRSGRRLGAIMLGKQTGGTGDLAAIRDALLQGVREFGLDQLPWSDKSKALRLRAKWAGISKLDDNELLEHLEYWLAPLLEGKRRLADVDAAALHDGLLGHLGWDELQQLDKLVPAEFFSPAGTRHLIDYGSEGGPTVEARVQAFFGLKQHPLVGLDKIPLVLSLTSPAGRPIQTTRDLPAFWQGSWRDVQKEMRGRYPRHHWPDDPANAAASLATKKKQGL